MYAQALSSYTQQQSIFLRSLKYVQSLSFLSYIVSLLLFQIWEKLLKEMFKPFLLPYAKQVSCIFFFMCFPDTTDANSRPLRSLTPPSPQHPVLFYLLFLFFSVNNWRGQICAAHILTIWGHSCKSGWPTRDHILKGNWISLLEKPSIVYRSLARSGASEFPFSMLECLQVWTCTGPIQGLCRHHSYYGFMRSGYHVKKALKNKCHMFSSMCGY